MKTLLRLLSLFALGTALAASLAAGPVLFSTYLSGDNEVPARDTDGSGQVWLWLDDDLSWTLSGTFADLEGDSRAAHIHGPALPTQNAGIVFHLVIPTDVRSGSISGAGVFNDQQAAWLREGLLYVNLHSAVYPGGELRGQLESVPDAASAGVTSLLALSLLVAARSRQRVRR